MALSRIVRCILLVLVALFPLVYAEHARLDSLQVPVAAIDSSKVDAHIKGREVRQNVAMASSSRGMWIDYVNRGCGLLYNMNLKLDPVDRLLRN